MADDFLRRWNTGVETAIAAAKQRRMDGERLQLLTSVGQDVANMLAPAIQEMAQSARMNKDDMREAMMELLGTVNSREMNIDTSPIIAAIQQAFVGLKLPEPKVSVTSPAVHIPDVVMPDEMNIKGWFEFMGIFKNSDQNPISVQLRDHKGNPVNLMENITQVGGGGGFRQVIISDIRASSSSIIDQALGAVKVTGSLSASLTLDYGSGEIGTNTPRFVMATDAVASVYVTGANGTIATNIIDSSGIAYSGSNPVPITIISGTITMSAITSTDAVATQDLPGMLGMNFGFNGASWDRLHTGTSGAGGFDSAGALRVTQATDVGVSVSATQVGTWNITTITNSVSASLVDSGGVQYSGSNALPVYIAKIATATTSVNLVDSSGIAYSGSNAVPITLAASGGTNTINVSVVDSGGVGYSGSNPLPITVISGALTSTIAVGASAEGAADDGSAPVQAGGLSRQANPGAIAGGSVVKASFDDLGRQLMRPVQVRDLAITAYASISTGTEATLLAASAGSFHDLVYLLLANSSDAAVLVDIRAVTAGNIFATLSVPANGTVGVSLGGMPAPGSGADTGNNWTIDMPDITGTTIYATALFSREV